MQSSTIKYNAKRGISNALVQKVKRWPAHIQPLFLLVHYIHPLFSLQYAGGQRLCYHPPGTSQNADQNEKGQDTGACLVTSGDTVESDGCLWRVCTSIRVAGRDTARLEGDRARDGGVEKRLDDFESGHGFTYAEKAIIFTTIDPPQTTLSAIGACITLLRCSYSRCRQVGVERVAGPWCDNGCVSHEAGEVGFERLLVIITFAVVFASNLAHDIVNEEYINSCDDASEPRLPQSLLGLVAFTLALVSVYTFA